MAKDLDGARRQLRCIAREARLLDLVPIIANLEALESLGEAPDRFAVLDAELPGRVFATASKAIARHWKRDVVTVLSRDISGDQLVKLLSRALPMAAPTDAEILATRYPLAPAYVAAAGRAAIVQAAGRPMTREIIHAGLSSVLDDRLAGMATRVSTTQTWDDVVLPKEQRLALAELIARVRERRTVHEKWGFAEKVGRGLGVAALFSGPPGTGKTMVAGLVAKSMGTPIYQVDTSKIVSKWIGETEKNLAALFNAAEAGHVVLLFDEADALFGKRTDVKSSNDRHSNQEVNYLLQRLESFKSVCILTTNHETTIDEAFRRRLAIHVRFEVPDAEERKHVWRTLIPDRAPCTAELHLDDLAQDFDMSGGYIKNAVMRAAFFAADEGCAIDARHLLRAAQLEYEAIGKIVASSPNNIRNVEMRR